MLAHGWKLSDEQVAAVVTCIRNSWATRLRRFVEARKQFSKHPD
jgi:hypothetical protein